MAAEDVVNRVLRENRRYTGDGLPGEPVNAPLPVGDPSSGVHNPKKSELRIALLEPIGATTADADRAEEAATRAETIAAAVTVGLAKARVVSTANINLAAPGAIIDGATMAAGQTFLAAGQSNPAQNGLFVWNGAAVPATRHPVYNTYDAVAGQYFSVLEGSQNGKTLWRSTSEYGGTLGTTPLLIEKYTAAVVVRRQVFTASGTYTPHAKMVYAEIECVGGGGAGGGSANSGAGTGGGAGGGGAGGLSKKIVSRSDIGASKPVVVGAGGAPGAVGSNPGGNGAPSSVDTLCVANGGLGAPAGFGTAGGAGAGAGTGDVVAPGTRGGSGPLQTILTVSAVCGLGADSVYGGSPGLKMGQANQNGDAATGYGAGGNGGLTWNAGGAVRGGAGSPGIVVITEMCTG